MSQHGSPPPYYPSSSEADPLIGPRKPSRRYQSLCVYAAIIALLIVSITIFSMRPSNDPLDPDVRDRIRKDWDIELRQHQKEVLERIDTQKRWRVEDNDRIRLREQWGSEVEKHNREVEERLRRDEEHRIHMHEQWKREIEEHDEEVKEGRRRDEEESIRIRERWRREAEEHDKEEEALRRREEQKRILLRKKWSREVEDHEREVEDRRQHEEEERLRLNMFWTDLASHTCTTYATREYTARLVNVPSYYNRRVEACMALPVKIHGAEYTPKWCEDHGPDNVIGHWEVDQHEPDCTSYWSSYKDLGCVLPGSGQRRIEHYLKNLPSGGNWKEFCATTPASFRGMHFVGAEFCFRKYYSTYGQWVLDDESCK